MTLHDSFSAFKRNPLQKRANDAILDNLNLATPPSRKDISFTLGRALESAPSPQVLQWRAMSGATYQLQVTFRGDVPTWNLLRVDHQPAMLIWKMVTEDPEQVYRMLLKRITPQGDFTKTTGTHPAYDEAEQQNLVVVTQSIGIGTVFLDRYRITEMIAKGGMGMVFKGYDMVMNRDVAIKLLHTHMVEDSKAKQRFEKEMSICINFKHPNVVSVFDYGYSPEQLPYMVMEYLDGYTLDDLQMENGPLSLPLFVRVFTQVCAALIHAHAKQYIHRDVKPRNIILIPQEDGDFIVKLVDFGIAKIVGQTENTLQKLTQTGDALGSPYYMSPEQCRSLDMDARSDIYSLGCVMYESISGKLPFNGPNAISTLFMHVNDRAEPFSAWRPDLSIPRNLEKIVLKMLEKDPLDRYQTVTELAADLAEFSKGCGVSGPLSPSDQLAFKHLPSTHYEEAEAGHAVTVASAPGEPAHEPVPDLPIIDAVLKVLIQAGIITGEDAKAAMTLHQWNGGSPVQYLVEFGCISQKTHESALQCLDMMDRYSLSLDDAALTLMYCHRKGITIEDALAEIE
jgi:tRNA A-37 threonylcarbamoyl transferase component Bud32